MDKLQACIARRPFLAAFLCSAAFCILLATLFNPVWGSNDDPGLSMVAHGYGMAAYGTPNLVFSNVLWGYIVRAIPTIHGVLGYSIATMLTLLAAATVSLWTLWRLGVGTAASLLVWVLLFARAILFPQFTINAGLLMIAAVLALQAYVTWQRMPMLITACLCAFAAFLIRQQQAMLMIVLALPVLPWRALLTDRKLQLAALLMLAALAAAWMIDRHAYSGEAWQHFAAFNRARAPITDFSVANALIRRPDLLGQFGLSPNDMELVRQWFFVDPALTDPERLGKVTAALGAIPVSGSHALARQGVRDLTMEVLWPLSVPALLLLCLHPARHVLAVAALIVAAAFLQGWFGRPGIVWVYYPMLAFGLVAAVRSLPEWKQNRRRAAWAILTLAVLYQTYDIIQVEREVQAQIKDTAAQIASLPSNDLVSWAAGTPYEMAYPVLGGDSPARHLHLYALGVFTAAPFSAAAADEAAGKGFLTQWKTEVLMAMRPEQIPMLMEYCDKHAGGALSAYTLFESERFSVYRVACRSER